MERTRILVPLDGSDFSRKALAKVASLFAPDKCEVTLVRVGELPPYASTPHPSVHITDGWTQMMTDFRSHQDRERAEHPVVVSQVWDNVRTELLDSLTDDVADLRDAGFSVRALARFGDPVEEIVALTETGLVDLIVMATHGRTGLQRVVMGSVAKGVLQRVSVDVMMVQIGRRARVKQAVPTRAEQPV